MENLKEQYSHLNDKLVKKKNYQMLSDYELKMQQMQFEIDNLRYAVQRLNEKINNNELIIN